jgi:hypothetical protein
LYNLALLTLLTNKQLGSIIDHALSLHRISLRHNDQGAVNNVDLHLRQGAAKQSQPMSNKYRQEVANEHQMYNTYEKLNP